MNRYLVGHLSCQENLDKVTLCLTSTVQHSIGGIFSRTGLLRGYKRMFLGIVRLSDVVME